MGAAVFCAGDPRLSNYVPVIARCLPEKQTFSDQTLPGTHAYPSSAGVTREPPFLAPDTRSQADR